MANQTLNGVISSDGAAKSLAALLASPLGAAATLRLYQSSFVPNADTPHADYVAAEANFTGYLGVAMTFGAISKPGPGLAQSLSNVAHYEATDAVAPNSIGGCWLDVLESSGPDVLAAVNYFPFPAPVAIGSAGASIDLVVRALSPNLAMVTERL